MIERLKRLWQGFRDRKRLQDHEALSDLKFRYHAFRILLANNDRSLDLINELETKIKRPGGVGGDLMDVIEELLHVTYEMVDGLNRLDGYTSEGLYTLHHRLSSSIREILDRNPIDSMADPLILHLEKIRPDQAGLVGGKASSLARLTAGGLPVPHGFVLTVAATRLFFEFNGLESKILDRLGDLGTPNRENQDWAEAAEEVRAWILSAKFPPELDQVLDQALNATMGNQDHGLAVRSSAAVEDQLEHSFAGQFNSIINVRGLFQVKQAVKEVWASHFNTRSLIYRREHQLPRPDFAMAVLVQDLVDASAAGVLYTLDPTDRDLDRALVSAVPALGTLAVDGGAPADIYYLSRSDPDTPPKMKIAEKTLRQVPRPQGGLVTESVPEGQRSVALLSPKDIRALAALGRIAEILNDGPQDVEWAQDHSGHLFVLQARPVSLPARRPVAKGADQDQVLLRGGMTSSPGRVLGRVSRIETPGRLHEGIDPAAILVLPQSLVEAASRLPLVRGVIVDLGNPSDHLSTVAREYGRPMITGASTGGEILQEGEWILLDADRLRVLKAPPEAVPFLEQAMAPRSEAVPGETSVIEYAPELNLLHDLIVPLNLTDAYGPTFSPLECRSLHDLIRYIHEAALMTMFSAADGLVEDHFSTVHWLDETLPLHFFIIDLGGGLRAGEHPTKVKLEEVVSLPFKALWNGVATPGLRWNTPPPGARLTGLLAKSLTEKIGVRELGSSNYALIARDYLNLNSRLDYHFVMIDALCGTSARENYIRFRFKGGGTTTVQRERRVRFIAEVLQPEGFFIDLRGDLITASLAGMPAEIAGKKLVVLGRLLGFSRLLDASMGDEDAPLRLAKAFFEEDWGLERFRLAGFQRSGVEES